MSEQSEHEEVRELGEVKDQILIIPLSAPGAASTTGAKSGVVAPYNLNIISAYLVAATTAPAGVTATPIAGQAFVADVNKNGTTIFTTQANRPTIADGGTAPNKGTKATPDVTATAAGDILTGDVDFIGSSAAGSGVALALHVEKA